MKRKQTKSENNHRIIEFKQKIIELRTVIR
jgi:hypothetical protein